MSEESDHLVSEEAGRRVWQAPRVIVGELDETETNTQIGPEVVILVS